MNEAAPPRSRRWAVLDFIVVLVLGGLLSLFYAGFFRADPRMAGSVKAVLWAVRIGFPPAALGLLAVYRLWRTGRVKGSSLGAAAFGTVFALLVAYPIGIRIYDRSFRKNIGGYHPFLQLAPNDLKLRPSSAGERPFRIFCLGGSTTEYRDPDGRGWPDRLEALLRDAWPGRTVEVYNAGRQWYTTEHMLIHYATNLRPLAPDMVIVMEAVNDLLQNADFSYYSFGPFRPDYGHFHGPAYRLIRRPTLEETAGRIFRSMWNHRPREVIDTDVFPGREAFERNLVALADLIRVGGASVVLMTQPCLYKEPISAAEEAALVMVNVEAVGPAKRWSAATARRGMDAYNGIVRVVAARGGYLLIDLERAVPKTLEYFWDDVHYLKPGFERVAGIVAAALRSARPDVSRRPLSRY
jgi:lysophospholipase L1-like esterase